MKNTHLYKWFSRLSSFEKYKQRESTKELDQHKLSQLKQYRMSILPIDYIDRVAYRLLKPMESAKNYINYLMVRGFKG